MILTGQVSAHPRQRRHSGRRRSDLYRAEILDNLYDAVITTDERFMITAWNKGAEQIYGWSADQARGQHLWELVPVDLTEAQRRDAIADANDGRPFRCTGATYRNDGTAVEVEAILIALRDEHEQGRVTGYVSIRRDTTEQRQGEEARKDLVRRLFAAHEEERARISRELHDDFGQQVTALKLKVAALQTKTIEHAEIAAQLASIETIVKRLDADIDVIAWQLRPAALDELGLAAAITTYVRAWVGHFNVRADLHVSCPENSCLSAEAESAIYRIMQEALHNVAKHAHAHCASVMLQQAPDHVCLIIEDDGRGFDSDQKPGSGDKRIGLAGMRERASLLGGSVAIESQPGRGTTVIARMPLETERLEP
jgi:PAS domain S-box-containing protein